MESVLNGIIGFVLGESLINDVGSYLIDPSGIEAISAAASSFSDVMKPIASVLICIYFIIELMEKITNDNFNTDQFIKLLIKLVFSIVVVDNASAIAENISKFGTAFISAISSADLTSKPFTVTEVNGLGIIDLIAMIVVMVIPFFVSLVIRLAAWFMIFSYIIEIQVRSALAPLGFADLISGGSNSNGFKYLKKLIALALQGGIMLIIMTCSAQLIGTSLLDDGATLEFELANLIPTIGNIFKIMAVQVAMLGLMGSAKTIANDVIG